MKLFLPAFALCGSLACDVDRHWPAPDPGLERMIDQPRANSYGASRWFADGKVMRPLPDGAIPWQESPPPFEVVARERDIPGIPVAVNEPRYVATIPIAVDSELLALGARRFAVFCAVCHGADGSSLTPVAAAMSVRKPPSLNEERIRGFLPGRIYAVISEGYGLMPSYALELEPRSRWAVVAFVQGLQAKQQPSTSSLPPSPAGSPPLP